MVKRWSFTNTNEVDFIIDLVSEEHGTLTIENNKSAEVITVGLDRVDAQQLKEILTRAFG